MNLIGGPAPRPCASCPYRTDVPAGVWHADEYAKLAAYDAPTGDQPQKVFLCHQPGRRVCAGWAGCHDGANLLALRLAEMQGAMTTDALKATVEYRSPVELFESGTAAAAHGLAGVDLPPRGAIEVSAKVVRARQEGEIALAVAALAGVSEPATVVDGSCVRWEPRITAALTAAGISASPVAAAGFVNDKVLAFAHRITLTGMGVVVDFTARQFAPDLPARWVTGWDDYRARLGSRTQTDVRLWTPCA